MGKIPVGHTIAGAYEFAFAGFLSVLGIVWLPYVALAAFSVGVVLLLAPDLPGHFMRGEFDAPVIYSVARVGGLIALASFLVRAMVTVGLQKHALSPGEGPVFVFFTLGAAVWRMIGAIFLAILSLIVIGVLTVIVAGAAAYAATKYVPNFGHALAIVVCIIAALWFIYACVRLTFFLPAVVVAEGGIGLGRAWELGEGNFWRIIGVMIVVFVPVAIGFAIVRGAVMGPFMPMQFMHPHFANQMTSAEFSKFYQDLLKSIMMQFRAAFPFLIVFGAVQELVNLGLANGAVAKAYLGVTGKGAAG